VDLLVVNDVSAPGAGFDHDTNAVVILGADGNADEVPLTSKDTVANAVLDRVISHLNEKRSRT
jgi:phosphopantothenoylcysteine decarboxylase/phosphopantothenate--cysteine ligase